MVFGCVGAKVARIVEDTTDSIVKSLCVPFDAETLGDLRTLTDSLKSSLLVQIPMDRGFSMDSGLAPQHNIFVNGIGSEAMSLVKSFEAFERKCCNSFSGVVSEENVLGCITEITGIMWKDLATIVDLQQVFSWQLNKIDKSGATVIDGRPDETDYLDDFMVCKSEHKDKNTGISNAIRDLTKKMVGYNEYEYGPAIHFLPVIAAAGTLVEFGVINVRIIEYHKICRYDLNAIKARLGCFVSAINFFRYMLTIAPHIPRNCNPLYRTEKDITFYGRYVTKQILDVHTCPESLYALLDKGSVPCAVKVKKCRKHLEISPQGTSIRNCGEILTLNQVRAAIKCVLTCIRFMHTNDYVHRDIRWPNIIMVSEFSFLMIDFEFAGIANTPMDIHEYIFNYMVAYNDNYQKNHDLELVGKLVEDWASTNNKELDTNANNFVTSMKHENSSVSDALEHIWLQNTPI